MEEVYELSEMRQEILDRVSTVMNKAREYKNSFSVYEYLWVDDRQEFMQQFLLYGHVLTPEEIEQHAEEGVPESPPTLDQFKEQVCFKKKTNTTKFCLKLSYISATVLNVNNDNKIVLSLLALFI